MDMPHVELAPSPQGVGYIEFRTQCGQVSGTALRASGCRETHYDVVNAHKVASAVLPRMACVDGAVAAFDVVGVVTFLFEDGLIVIAAHGFTFWIAPNEMGATIALGDHVACRIENLTLFV